VSETRRAAIIVLDGVGCGAAPDAPDYGDSGSHTLGNIAVVVGGLKLPNLERLGLGRIAPLHGVHATERPEAAWGLMIPKSAGKDSTTGHWEIAGVHLGKPFPTYPNGFPGEVIERFSRRTGRAVIGNLAASGTTVLADYGNEHVQTGAWIVYTSADSVFQVAAHEEVVPLEELYRACETASQMRRRVDGADSPLVARAIARPFTGESGVYRRTANRRDFSVPPPSTTLLDELESAGIPRSGVGKVDDLFAGRGISSTHTPSNTEGIHEIAQWLATSASGLLLANLVDFDQQFGHRNDVSGYYRALQEFDAALPSFFPHLRQTDLLFVTADHGNDPTTASTDHSRECVPLLAVGPRVVPRDIGRRDTFADLGATVAEWFGIAFRGAGTSFLPALLQR
jgi:phosphopentomutase